MVANGHSWSSIKEYTLSEIGVFYRTIILKEREDKVDSLIHNWISTHYDYQGLQETVDSLKFKKVTSNFDKPEKEEVLNEWKRLSNFMSKRK